MAEEGHLATWSVEDIPDSDRLYMRVHKTWLKVDGTISAGVLENHGAGMSTDWSRYSSAEATRERARKPVENAVVEMVTREVRAVPGQRVQHSPLPENRAHTVVLGEKDEEARVLLRRICKIVLPLTIR